jgi:methylmalonyl-CoA/ethylmalonyl-CoA epimerase
MPEVIPIPAPRLRFDHIGVAVPRIEAALEFYRTALGYKVRSGPFDDAEQQARVVFIAGGPDEPFVIELIAPLHERSHVHRLLERGAGAYHLCYETIDIHEAMKRLASSGCLIVRRPTPATAYAGRKIAWLYTPAKQLMELVEAPLTE